MSILIEFLHNCWQLISLPFIAIITFVKLVVGGHAIARAVVATIIETCAYFYLCRCSCLPGWEVEMGNCSNFRDGRFIIGTRWLWIQRLLRLVLNIAHIAFYLTAWSGHAVGYDTGGYSLLMVCLLICALIIVIGAGYSSTCFDNLTRWHECFSTNAKPSDYI